MAQTDGQTDGRNKANIVRPFSECVCVFVLSKGFTHSDSESDSDSLVVVAFRYRHSLWQQRSFVT